MDGIALLQQGRAFEALKILSKKAKRDPSLPNLLALASAQRGCYEFDLAHQTLRKCHDIEPNSPEVWNNLAQIFTDLGKFPESVNAFAEAARCAEALKVPMLTASLQNILYGFGQSLLRLGHFERGWPLWEYGRFASSWHTLPGVARWEKQPCDSLLVVCEGGYGDAMMFSRWLPECAKLAKRVSLLIWDEMAGFWNWQALGVADAVFRQRTPHEKAEPIAGVVPISSQISPGNYQYMTSWMSFPALFGLDMIPGYPPREELFWSLHSGERAGIGFCWAAGEPGRYPRVKSLSGGEAVSVQEEIVRNGTPVPLCPKDEGRDLPPRMQWMRNRSWRETAELISSLACVVTVDTAVAHLAGVLKIPALVLLPLRSDWRWQTAGKELNWYGPRMQYFRNPHPSKWDTDAIVNRVRQLVESTEAA